MAFGRSKDRTRVTLHLGGRDIDVLLEGDQSRAWATAEVGMINSHVLTLRPPDGPMMTINWSAVPAFTVQETFTPS